MEKRVIFRDYQEQQAQDHNDLQAFTRATTDHITYDAVTKTRRYAGFGVIKSSQAEIQIAPGRFYDVLGAMFHRDTTLVQSMLTYLPAVASRKVLVSVYGVENESDIEERDFLVDVDTGRTEPDAVATTASRDAVLTLSQGAESTDPQPPAIPIGHAAIAYITLDPIQVTLVEMLPDFAVLSTEDLDIRTDDLEAFRDQIGPRVTALASDLAALQALLKDKGNQVDVTMIYRDLGELKTKAGLPATYSQYGADYFINPTQDSDTTDAQSLGYDANVEMGARFPAANADIFEMSLFSANDPNAAFSGGLLLPKFTNAVAIAITAYHDDLGIAQYGYQTFALVQNTITVSRLRYGGGYTQCTNGVVFGTQTGEAAPTWLPNFQTYETVDTTHNQGAHVMNQIDYWWHDSWTETYWSLKTINHTVTGAQVAQTFLNANDMWATQISFYITAKAAAENIIINLCETVNGQPDINAIILHQVYDQASIRIGWNDMLIIPTFLERGKRYGLIFTSNANHRIGMAFGQRAVEGTFFFSTDGAYFLGDLTKDMLMKIWAAKFISPQSTIEFAPINLDGGLRDIDISASTVVPSSTDLIYEIRPNGTGDWEPLTPENLTALNGAPPLIQFRGRFIGTRDVQPGVMLTGSRVYVQRPKLAFKHISLQQTLAIASTSIFVRCTLERFDDTPHDFTCQLHVSTSPATINPSTTTDEVLDTNLKRINRTFHFTIPSNTHFTIMMTAATNSPANLFHVAERLFWAL